MIKVYTTPDCMQCDQTKKFLDRNHVPYDAVDLTTNPDAMKLVQDMGYKSAPVVIVDGDDWSGFRFDKLKDVVAKHREKH